MKKKFILMMLILSIQQYGCGVKGDPVPPLQPVELKRGRPTTDSKLKEDFNLKNPGFKSQSDEDVKKRKKTK